jgi:hypothetical protein
MCEDTEHYVCESILPESLGRIGGGSWRGVGMWGAGSSLSVHTRRATASTANGMRRIGRGRARAFNQRCFEC